LASSDRSSVIPYAPANPPYNPTPDNLCRATWDELYRLEQALRDIDKPAALAATCSEPIAVQAATVWDRLLNENVTFQWENPRGQLNPATGVWTCPQEGLYQIDAILESPPFPTPAAKQYTASIRVTVAGTSLIAQNSGEDTKPVRVSAAVMRPLNRGDTVTLDADLTHQNKTGTVTCFGVLNILRVGSIK